MEGGFSVTRVRLKISRDQYDQIVSEAEAHGKSVREFLRCKLRAALGI